MTTEYCTNWSNYTLQALQSWKKIGETNLAIAEKLFGAQIELATALVDVISLNGEEIAATKDVKEIASLQAEIAQVSGKLILENAQSTASILAEAGKAYSQVCEASLKSAANSSSKAKKAAA